MAKRKMRDPCPFCNGPATDEGCSLCIEITVVRSSQFALVIVESPFAGDVERNTRYARACLADCLSRGESPFASHLLFTQKGVLDDNDPDQRKLGIAAGFAWRHVAQLTAVYGDLGISSGMRRGIEHSERLGIPVEFRSLPEWAE